MNNQRLIKGVIFTSVTMLAIMAVGFVIANINNPLNTFRFNPFALLSIAAIISNVVLLILVNRPRNKSPETFWFSLFLIEIVYWAFCEMMQRLSATPEAAIAWYSITSAGWIFIGVTYWLYTLQATDNMRLIRNFFGMLAIIVAPIGFMLLALKTNLIVDYDTVSVIANPWGYYSVYGPLFNYFLVWLEVFFIASLIIMFRRYKSTKDPRLKQQALASSIALSIPLVIGSFTDGLLPAFQINVLPLAITLTSIQAAITGYAIMKYRIFTVNPNTLAPNILAGMNEIVLILNKNYVIEYANERAYTLLGYPADSLLGSDINRLFKNPKELEYFKERALSAGVNSKFQSSNVEIKTAHESSLPVIASSAQITNTDGGEPAFVLVLTDISQVQKVEQKNKILEDTKRAMLNALEDAQVLEAELKKEKTSVERKVAQRTKQLLEEQAKLQASINSLQMGFMIIDMQGELISSNEAALRILQLKPGGVTMKEVTSVLKESVDLPKKISECISNQLLVDVKDLKFGPKYIKLNISPITVAQHQVIGVVIVIQDITEEKVLQRSRDEFFSIASHELRTPLTAIRGNTSMIQDYFPKVLEQNNEIKEMINDIHNSSIRLIDIVNDFLDATRLEQGGMEFKYEEVDVAKVADLVVYDMQSIAKEKGIYIKNIIGKQPRVNADLNRVKQVIYNLVGNAMKFTKSGGIKISAVVEEKFLKIRVVDTGQGIPEGSESLLFHKFQQAGSSLLTRDNTRGTGLGLYISKLLVENMGGTINLESTKVGKGTTFYFTVPLAVSAKFSSKKSQSAKLPIKSGDTI